MSTSSKICSLTDCLINTLILNTWFGYFTSIVKNLNFFLDLSSKKNHTFDYLFGEFSNKLKNVQGNAENEANFLFGSGFDEESCLSRFQATLYRKPSSHKPSSYLLSKLRNYETLHQKCGPYTKSYNQTLKSLNSSNISTPTECKYVVWTVLEGLGNRILTMASAFLYAVLTDRVLLVEHESDMSDLFCEPFLNTSWLLPQDFPSKNKFRELDLTFPDKYGNLVRNNIVNLNSMSSFPSVAYLFLAFNCDDSDKLFYCQEHQDFLRKVPWLILKSDQYFVPFLFLIPSFEQELQKMFPDKETVFHFLGRYLFNPSNKAWGLITRFYDSYLAKADQRIGMQVRIFNPRPNNFRVAMDQILACTIQENLLPEVNKHGFLAKNWTSESKAVLIASLYVEFYENLRNMYWKFPTINGEVIQVYQASHEGHQQSGNSMHNLKAWIEMNLLSFSDVLVTSSWSTFGYVAQGLGGLKPWILYRPENWQKTYRACSRAVSTEPCFHFPPSYQDCKRKMKVDLGMVVPYIKHCEDEPRGIKLFNKYNTSSA